MLTKQRILFVVLSLLFLKTEMLYGARIEIGSVPLPPENDPVFKICARGNILPSQFIEWGFVDFVEKREDIQQYTLKNPRTSAKVKFVTTSSPLLYYSEKWKEYHTEYMYTFNIGNIVCGFKAIYSPPTYDDSGVMLEDGGLYYLEYKPQPQPQTITNVKH